MILDLAGTISKLVNRVETHQDKVERQFKNFSKKMNQTTVGLCTLFERIFKMHVFYFGLILA
jgi:hypothetical protein